MKNLKMSSGTFSNTQTIVPVLLLHQGPAASSQGPSASTNSEDEYTEDDDEYGHGKSDPAIQSSRSHDSGRTVLHPDLHVLTNDEHWPVTPETHKYAAEARSFCFLTTENGEQQHICNLTTMPCVQRSLCLDEVTNDSSSTQVEVPKGVDKQTRDMLERCMANCGKAAGARAKRRSRARKEASAQEVRGYYKQFAEAKHLEYKSLVDNEVFDLIDMRKVKPKNYVTRQWVLTIKTDKQGNFPRTKARWALRALQDKQKDYQQTVSPASTRPGFRMSCQMAPSQGWNLFPIDLKTAFLQGQPYDSNRDVVCQLPPEADHPPYIAAILKKPAYDMNDAPRRCWNILDKALRSYGMVPHEPIDAVTCCIRYCRVSELGITGDKGPSHSSTAQKTPLIESRETSEMEAAFEKNAGPIAGSPATGKSVTRIINLFVDDLYRTGGNEMEQRVLTRIRKYVQVGSEDWNDVAFTGQRILWTQDPQTGPYIEVSQEKAIEELEEIPVERNTKEDLQCTPAMHTMYRSLLG